MSICTAVPFAPTPCCHGTFALGYPPKVFGVWAPSISGAGVHCHAPPPAQYCPHWLMEGILPRSPTGFRLPAEQRHCPQAGSPRTS